MAKDRYLVLARKWRPQSFDDVVGQEHITRTLKNAISSGRIHHAFLFIGSRGIGKTTSARILAKALNCLNADEPTPEPCGTCDNCVSISQGNNIDVIEIDGASNNGVEDVREIRDNIRMVPTNGRYKVYIIDEVHQLSTAAFNALLKTLEEPPPHALFILATTEAHKIPATIISRCQRYDFRRVPIPNIVELLNEILDAEGIKASPEALHAIARAAEGGIRDAESILDELITYCDGEINFKDVFDVLGLVDWGVLNKLSQAILDKDIASQLQLVDDVISGGKDLSQFVEEILRYYRNLLICKTAPDAGLLKLPDDEITEMKTQAGQYPLTVLINHVEEFAKLHSSFDSQLAQRIALESLLIRISRLSAKVTVDTVLEKIIQLGEQGVSVSSGTPAPKPVPRKAPSPPPGPPADPPEAGATPLAPPQPAPVPQREAIREEQIPAFWKHLQHAAGEIRLSTGTWLGSAKSVRMDGDKLILSYSAMDGKAREHIEQADNRQVLEKLLQERTQNLRTFSTEVAAADPENFTPAEIPADKPYYPNVNKEEALAALKDPGIAHAVEVFKGNIAAFQSGTESTLNTNEGLDND